MHSLPFSSQVILPPRNKPALFQRAEIKPRVSNSFSLTHLHELPRIQTRRTLRRRFELTYLAPATKKGSKKVEMKNHKVTMIILRWCYGDGSTSVLRFWGKFKAGEQFVEANGFWCKNSKTGMLFL